MDILAAQRPKHIAAGFCPRIPTAVSMVTPIAQTRVNHRGERERGQPPACLVCLVFPLIGVTWVFRGDSV